MIISVIFIHAGTVEKLRSVGVCLPSSSTLYRKKAFGVSSSGWNQTYVTQMKEALEQQKVNGWGKYGMICFDEVKIKEGVVYNPHSGKLVGQYRIWKIMFHKNDLSHWQCCICSFLELSIPRN